MSASRAETVLHAVTKFELAQLEQAIERALSNHNTNMTITYGSDTNCSCPACEILRDALQTTSRVSRASAPK